MIKRDFYNIISYDDVIVIETFGSWDQTIAKECFEDILQTVTKHYLDRPYAICMNNTKWELNAPDTKDFWKETFANKNLHHPTHTAIVIGDSELKRWAIEKIYEATAPFEMAIFSKVDEGIVWLKSKGYQVSYNLETL